MRDSVRSMDIISYMECNQVNPNPLCNIYFYHYIYFTICAVVFCFNVTSIADPFMELTTGLALVTDNVCLEFNT